MVQSFRPLKVAALLTALVLVMGAPGTAHSGRQIIIAPTRIVFEKGKRTATVHVSNKGETPVSLRISVVDKRMLDTGLIVDVDAPEPDEHFLKEMIRFSPRRIVLKANGTQTVRLLLREPASSPLPPGEYRSHLRLRTVPPPPPSQPKGPAENSLNRVAGEITISARPIIETSIPLIYRKGTLSASTRFSSTDTHLGEGPRGIPTLTVRLEREGDRSVYGDIEVNHVASDGSVHQLAYLGGVAVYTPTASRRFTIGLRVPEGIRLDAGKLKVSFRERNQPADAPTSQLMIALDRTQR